MYNYKYVHTGLTDKAILGSLLPITGSSLG